MKRFTSVFCLILVCFLTFTFVGCNSKDNEENKAQDAAKKYLNTYYTIDKSDMELFRAIAYGNKDANKLMQDFEKSNNKFKDILTDKAYQSLVANRMSYERMREAAKKEYYVAVKNIKLVKYTEDKKEQMIAYKYTMELTQTPFSGNEIKSIEDTGIVHVFKVGNDWRTAE